jgi:hypothetical protein
MSDLTNGNSAVTAWLESLGPLRPFAVPIPTAQVLLGNKAKSEVYKAGGNGLLDFVKDGSKTLITVDSIVRYCARKMKPARINPVPPKRKPSPAERTKRREAAAG